ncbi:MAG: hypothetical protein J6B64_04920, partial [Bacilli bacterium]|nr:hypothetical protein [Bacilli bacterium]
LILSHLSISYINIIQYSTIVRNTKCIKKLDFSISSEDFYNTTVKLGGKSKTLKFSEIDNNK